MSVSEYAYVNARIGAMKSYLLKDEDFRGLVETRGLEDLASQLKNLNYDVDIAEPNVLSLELQLKRSLYRDYLKLVNCVRGKPKEFVHNMAKKFEIDTIKSIIKMKTLDITLSEYLIPFGRLNEVLIESLLKSDGIYGVIESLNGTEYYEPLRKVHKAKTGKSETVEEPHSKDLPYINALDAYYFAGVRNSLAKLSGKDKSMVSRFVGFSIDLSNLNMALRLRDLEGEFSGFFIEGGEGFTERHFNIVMGLEDLSNLSKIVPPKLGNVCDEAAQKFKESNSLVWFDIFAKQRLLKESRKLFLGGRFHIGTVIAYLNLKENEIANLIKIIKTKDEMFKTKDIEELLVLG